MHTRRYSATIVLLIALLGMTALSEALERLLQVIPIIDIIQLVGVGVCFGIALSAIYNYLRNHKDPDL